MKNGKHIYLDLYFNVYKELHSESHIFFAPNLIFDMKAKKFVN